MHTRRWSGASERKRNKDVTGKGQGECDKTVALGYSCRAVSDCALLAFAAICPCELSQRNIFDTCLSIQRQSARADNATLLTRIHEVEKSILSHQAREIDAIQEQNKQLASMSEQISHQKEAILSIVNNTRETFRAVLDLREMFQALSQFVVN
jgi:hypothetical protein